MWPARTIIQRPRHAPPRRYPPYLRLKTTWDEKTVGLHESALAAIPAIGTLLGDTARVLADVRPQVLLDAWLVSGGPKHAWNGMFAFPPAHTQAIGRGAMDDDTHACLRAYACTQVGVRVTGGANFKPVAMHRDGGDADKMGLIVYAPLE